MQAIKIYSMRVAMLFRLYDLKLINDKEYKLYPLSRTFWISVVPIF